MNHLLSLIPSLLLILLVLAFLRWPLFFCRFVATLVRVTCLRIRVDGPGRIPSKGPAMLVANHVAFFDFLVILSITWRPVHFMVQEDFFRIPLLAILFRMLGILKVPSARHPQALRRFFKEIQNRLRCGEVVCVFPEGGISENGLLQQFHAGIDNMIPSDIDVPVIPIRVGMFWGRLLAFHQQKMHFLAPRYLRVQTMVTIGNPIDPHMGGFRLRQLISEMGADSEKQPFPGELPIHTAFFREARRHPFHWSYKDFGGKAARGFPLLVKVLVLSKQVRKLDPGEPGGYVGVLLPNCSALCATILAVLCADRQPTILNYSTGAAVMAQSMERAGVKLVLTSRKFLEKLNITDFPNAVCLEDVAPKITPAEKRRCLFDALLLPWRLLARKYAPESAFDLNRTAVLLFSSGSTGKPKGVILSHRNINSNIYSFWRCITWSRDYRIIGCLPVFHAFGFTVGFAFPAMSGTRVVFLTNFLDATLALKLIETEKIRLMVTTPTFLLNYLRRATPEQLRSLRLVITGAEKLRSDIIRRFEAICPGRTIVEGYGCTELSPIVSVNFARNILLEGKAVGKPDSIGAELPGIHVRITDPATGEELPPYRSGMMEVKGGLVMQGYLNDPEQTAKVMHGDYYRTGDIASMSPDGYITITGRLSRFSKIGGEMVPHELVERAISELLECESHSVAVTGRSDPKRGEKLMVIHSIPDLNPTEIIMGLRRQELPNLWIPKADDFFYMEKLPLLGNGKLDLQKLKAIAEEH